MTKFNSTNIIKVQNFISIKVGKNILSQYC